VGKPHDLREIDVSEKGNYGNSLSKSIVVMQLGEDRRGPAPSDSVTDGRPMPGG
jgi:hypothetical protein